MKSALLLSLLLLAVGLTGCVSRHQVKVAPISVKPIHMEIDVNLREDGKDGDPAQTPPP